MVTDDFTLTFSRQHLMVLNAALVERPWKEAAPVIDEINRQLLAKDAEEKAHAKQADALAKIARPKPMPAAKAAKKTA